MKKSISTLVPLLFIILTTFIFLFSILQQPVQAATLTVTKTADTNDGNCSSDCSLREALGAASNGDTINFANSLSGMTLTLQTAVSINKALTIDGSTLPTRATIQMSGSEKIFGISNTIALNSLIFKNGLTDGAIHNTGNLTIYNVHFENNEVDSGNGGAINNEGSLIIDQSTFVNNQASNLGGAIYNKLFITSDSPLETIVKITNSTFDQNASLHGGAIFNDFDIEYTMPTGPEGRLSPLGISPSASLGYVEIHNSTISNNSALRNGGGIANYALQKEVASPAELQATSGASLYAHGIVYIAKSNIVSNTAVSYGGGIHNTVITPTLTPPVESPLGAVTYDGYAAVLIEQTTIANNNANDGAGLANTTSCLSPVQMIQSPTALPADNIVIELTDSLLENNKANSRGGGLYMGDELGAGCNPNPTTPIQPDIAIVNSTFVNNSANEGGGAFNKNGRVVIGNSTFSANNGAQGAALVNLSQTELWHTTIYSNTIIPAARVNETNGIGGSASVYNENDFIINNSIIAGTNGPATEDCFAPMGTTTGSNNIILVGTSCIIPEITVNPNLQPLAKQGQTPTHAILANSSAVDTAGILGCGHYLINYKDQNGLPRPASGEDEGGQCDIGAFEYLLKNYLPLILKN